MYAFEIFEKMIEDCITKDIILFGTSMGGLMAKRTLFRHLKVKYFTDNNKSKWGTPFLGTEVIPPEQLLKEANCVIIICSTASDEIISQLNEMGLADSIYDIRLFIDMKRSPNYEKMAEVSITHMEALKDPFDPLGFAKLVLDNNSKIQQVHTMLEDEKSKYIYSKVMKNRKFGYQNYTDIWDMEEQYFPKDVMRFSEDEIFFDVGALDGDTSLKFEKTVNGKFNKICLFEIDPYEYFHTVENISRKSKNKDKYEFFSFGLYNENKTILLDNQLLTVMNDKGSVETEVKTLDSLDIEGITYLKMDIEGAEQAALLGAEHTIKKYKPKLAICLYHRTKDLWEIPIMIHNMVPEYKFFVRHHSPIASDTVLYAYC